MKKILAILLTTALFLSVMPMEGLLGLGETIALRASAEEIKEDGDFRYTLKDGAVTVTGYSGAGGVCVIPEKIQSAPVTKIGANAFKGATLTAVTVPDTVTEIGAAAFARCSKLSTVKLSSSLKKLGGYAFAECDALTGITIPANLQETTDEYYNEFQYGYHYGVFFGCDNLKTVRFAQGITRIANGLFANNSSIVSVTIPDTVTVIGSNAFGNATALKTVQLSKTLQKIEANAFYCAGLTEITVPDTVTVIGAGAFAKCAALSKVKLSSSLKKLGGYAFAECDALTGITIPANLQETTDEYYNEFQYGYHYGVFFGCDNLKAVRFAQGITRIANGLFANNSSIVSVTIPDTVTVIGSNAFGNATALKTVQLSKTLQKIEANAFYGAGLTEITVPDTVTVIGAGAFAKCAALSKVKLSSSLEKLGGYAFAMCSALTEITIPASLKETTSEYYNEFRYDYHYGVFFGCDNLKDVRFQTGTTRIAKGLFAQCSGLDSFTVPEGVTAIDGAAFEDCENLAAVYLPASVEVISNSAFNGTDAVLFTPDYSVTLWHAVLNEKDVIVTDPAPEKPDAVLDRAASRVTCRANVASTFISVQVEVRQKKNAPAYTDPQIRFSVPQCAELLQESVRFNGEETQNLKKTDGCWAVDIPAADGVLEYTLKLNGTDYTVIAAALCTRSQDDEGKGSKLREELVGAVRAGSDMLTLDVPDETSEAKIAVSGSAYPGRELALFIDGEQVAEATVSATGRYYRTLELPDIADGKSYVIEVRTADEGEECSVAKRTFFSKNAVKLLSFRFTYYYAHTGKQKTIDLMKDVDKRPSVIVYIHEPMRFEVKVSNPEKVEALYVTSTKGSEKKMLRAEYDKANGLYIAEGYFDPNDIWYTPGELNVEFTEKLPDPSQAQNITEKEIERLVDSYPEELAALEPTVEETDDGGRKIHICFGDMFEDFDDDELIIIDNQYAVGSKAEAETVMGGCESKSPLVRIKEYVLKNGRFIIKTDRTDPYQKIVHVYSESAKTVTRLVFSLVKKASNEFGIDKLMEELQPLFQRSGFGENLYPLHMLNIDRNEVIRRIYSVSGNDAEKRDGLLQDFSWLESDEASFFLYAIYAVAMAGIVIAVAPHVGLLATVLIGAVAVGALALANFGFPKVMNDCIGRFLNFLMDPSGVVYEAVESNVLENVKTTIRYKDPETGSAVIWDAETYDQHNPLFTDDAGQYAWDVTEGLWQVTYEKDGYTTAVSDWMEVPPPRTGVNVGLVSTRAPGVASLVCKDGVLRLVFDQYVDVKTVNAATASLKTAGGKAAAGSWTPENAEPAAADPSQTLATSFVFRPAAALDGTLNAKVSGVVNYAGKKMAKEYSAAVKVSGLKPSRLPGDVDGSGDVSAADARLALRAAVGLETYAPGSAEYNTADADHDGTITAGDARLILRAAVGLETLQ